MLVTSENQLNHCDNTECAKHCFLVLQRQPAHLSDSFEEYPGPIENIPVDQQITLFRKRRNYWLVFGDLPTGTLYNNNNKKQ